MLQGFGGGAEEKKKIQGHRLSCSSLAGISSPSFRAEGCNYRCEMRGRAGKWSDGAGKGHAGRVKRPRASRLLLALEGKSRDSDSKRTCWERRSGGCRHEAASIISAAGASKTKSESAAGPGRCSWLRLIGRRGPGANNQPALRPPPWGNLLHARKQAALTAQHR